MYEVIFNRAANKLSTFTACGLTADSVTQRRKGRRTVGSPESLSRGQGPTGPIQQGNVFCLALFHMFLK